MTHDDFKLTKNTYERRAHEVVNNKPMTNEEIVEEFNRICEPDVYGRNCVTEDWLRSILTTKDAEKADWLRSEIEKLERFADENDDGMWSGREVVDSIITRYKEELLELEKGI